MTTFKLPKRIQKERDFYQYFFFKNSPLPSLQCEEPISKNRVIRINRFVEDSLDGGDDSGVKEGEDLKSMLDSLAQQKKLLNDSFDSFKKMKKGAEDARKTLLRFQSISEDRKKKNNNIRTASRECYEKSKIFINKKKLNYEYASYPYLPTLRK
jgi:hypothetical protein